MGQNLKQNNWWQNLKQYGTKFVKIWDKIWKNSGQNLKKFGPKLEKI